MEITKEHKLVALVEINVDRKYRTRHGLQFNKLRKLQFSSKIIQLFIILAPSLHNI